MKKEFPDMFCTGCFHSKIKSHITQSLSYGGFTWWTPQGIHSTYKGIGIWRIDPYSLDERFLTNYLMPKKKWWLGVGIIPVSSVVML